MSNNKKRLDFKSGFTLIEIIVTIAILGIVLTMAYSMGAFGRNSFNNGSVKADMQSNARLAANYITKELRYSSNATILTKLPATKDLIENYKYIYVDKDGILMQYDKSKNPNPTIVGDASNKISILKFEIEDTKTVDFTIKNKEFILASKVSLLNRGVSTLLLNDTGPVISYTNIDENTNGNTGGNSTDKPADLSPSKIESIYIMGENTITKKGSVQLSCYVKPGDKLAKESKVVNRVEWRASDSKARIDEGILYFSGNSIKPSTIIRVTAIAILEDGSEVISEPHIVKVI